jgi:hypothetical protein
VKICCLFTTYQTNQAPATFISKVSRSLYISTQFSGIAKLVERSLM